jgi:hypothetical protein
MSGHSSGEGEYSGGKSTVFQPAANQLSYLCAKKGPVSLSLSQDGLKLVSFKIMTQLNLYEANGDCLIQKKIK